MTSRGEEPYAGARAASDSALDIPNGTAVGVYRIDGVLGHGGMGIVYRATDTKLDRPVAVKFLSAPVADAQARRRFQQEARTASSLNHPHIVTVYDVDEFRGNQYIVSELVDGGTLDDSLRSRRPSAWRQSVEQLLGVADAIAAAHAAGVLHRDIKPANILIDANGYAKLADFGLVKLLEADAPRGPSAATATARGIVVGTVAYMSPEQATSRPLDARSDVFSFGIVLYEALAGRRPFDADNDLVLLKTIVHGTPAPLPSEVPELLRNVVERALEKDPADRYQSMRDLVSDLRRVARRGAAATSPSGVTAVPRRRTSRWPIAAAASAALAAVAVGVWYAAQRVPAAAEPAPGLQLTPSARAPTIAVLPFVNLSADPEQEYFSDGLSDELINQLGHIDGLQVTARGSAFAFKGRSEDLRSIGKVLGVANILEGSVRKSEGRIRVSARLVDAAAGYNVWSENYESELGDVFAIQDRIATAVAAKLGPTLGLRARGVDYGGTTNFDAYDHLLRGLADAAIQATPGFRPAINEFRAALAIDPSYARASAELAINISILLNSLPPGGEEAAQLNGEREEAARRALTGAPDSPLSLVAKMWLHTDRHEWVEADEACARAFAAARDARAEWFCGGFLTVTGRVRAGLPYREAAARNDPLAMSVATTLVRQYALLDMGDELAREYEREQGLPGYRFPGDGSMLAYLMHRGAPRQEIADRLERECAARVAAAPPPAGITPGCVVWARAIRSPEQAGPLLREQLDLMRAATPNGASSVALYAAYLGDRDLVLESFRVLAAGSSSSLQTMWYPLFSDVRKDPRFKTLVREIGLVDLWRKTGRWADACRPLGENDFECF